MDTDRDLLVRTLAQDITARILREVGGPAPAVDAAALRLEQPGRELRQGGLAGSVRADERNDLAPPQFEAGVVEDEQVVFVSVGDSVQARRDFAEVM